MLDLLRRAVRSWVAKILLGLLVVSFAVWGVGDIATGSSRNVATVGDQSVPADLYATVLRREQQRYTLDPTQIRATGLDGWVLARMIREAAMDDAAARMGISAPDDAVARQVRRDPAFQIGGVFDPVQYASAVRRNYPSIANYEEMVRRALASSQIAALAQTGVRAPQGAAEALIGWREERRGFDVLTLSPLPDDPAVAEPTDEDLQAWLDANPGAFEAPERRDVAFIHIDVATLAETPSDEDLRARFEERRAFYDQPETRAVDQIVFTNEFDAQAARDRIDAGEADFAAILTERGLSAADAALGVVDPADLPDARGEAIFALDGPGVAGPVATPTGFALLNVREISPGRSVQLDDVRDEIAAEIGAERARPQADRLAETAIDMLAGGATLDEIAAELGVAVQTVEALSRNAASARGIVASPTFQDEAFAAREREERDPVRTPEGGYILLRVDRIAPPVTPPLESIRDAVAGVWRADAQADMLADLAEALRQRLLAGETIADLAAERLSTIESVPAIRRMDPDPRVDPDARDALFLGRPGDAAVSRAGDRAALVVLREIVAPGPSADATALADALRDSLAADQFEYLGRALEARSGVSINPQTIEAVLSQIGA